MTSGESQARITRRLLLVFAITMITACSTYEAKPLIPAETAATFKNRSLNEPGLRAFIDANTRQTVLEWPLTRWGLDDLTLAGLYFNPDIAVAYAQWEVATAGKISAGEYPNPDISIGPAYNQTSVIPSPWIATFSFNFTLETAGKRDFRQTIASQLAEATRMDILSAAWQVRDAVRSRFIELYSAREQKILLEQQQTIQRENLRLLNLQFDAGAISAYELTQARLASDNSQLDLYDAERQSAEALVQLAKAIGVAVSAMHDVEFSFDKLELPAGIPADELRQHALLNRTDILASLAKYAASQSELQLEIARQYPDISLGPGYEYDQGDNKWSLGLSLTLPVFNQNQGAIAEAEARRTEAAANFVALQAQVLAEIDLALASYRSLLEKQMDVDAMLASQLRQEEHAQAMFDAGEIPFIELVGLRLQVNSIALTRLKTEADLQKAAGQLESSLQTPLGHAAYTWPVTPPSAESQAAGSHL